MCAIAISAKFSNRNQAPEPTPEPEFRQPSYFPRKLLFHIRRPGTPEYEPLCASVFNVLVLGFYTDREWVSYDEILRRCGKDRGCGRYRTAISKSYTAGWLARRLRRGDGGKVYEYKRRFGSCRKVQFPAGIPHGSAPQIFAYLSMGHSNLSDTVIPHIAHNLRLNADTVRENLLKMERLGQVTRYRGKAHADFWSVVRPEGVEEADMKVRQNGKPPAKKRRRKNNSATVSEEKQDDAKGWTPELYEGGKSKEGGKEGSEVNDDLLGQAMGTAAKPDRQRSAPRRTTAVNSKLSEEYRAWAKTETSLDDLPRGDAARIIAGRFIAISLTVREKVDRITERDMARFEDTLDYLTTYGDDDDSPEAREIIERDVKAAGGPHTYAYKCVSALFTAGFSGFNWTPALLFSVNGFINHVVDAWRKITRDDEKPHSEREHKKSGKPLTIEDMEQQTGEQTKWSEPTAENDIERRFEAYCGIWGEEMARWMVEKEKEYSDWREAWR